jgi:hypothetical protein
LQNLYTTTLSCAKFIENCIFWIKILQKWPKTNHKIYANLKFSMYLIGFIV